VISHVRDFHACDEALARYGRLFDERGVAVVPPVEKGNVNLVLKDVRSQRSHLEGR
jgi:hypothetical protein